VVLSSRSRGYKLLGWHVKGLRYFPVAGRAGAQQGLDGLADLILKTGMSVR
jgi:hypothetical protein